MNRRKLRSPAGRPGSPSSLFGLRGRAGWSLAEVSLACALLVLLVLTTLLILHASQQALEVGMATDALEAEARDLVERIVVELRQAGSSTLVPTNANGSTELSFQQNAGFADGAIRWGPVVTYALRDQPTLPGSPPLRACVRISGERTLEVGRHVTPSGLTFTRTAGGMQLCVTLQRDLPEGQAVVRTVTTSVALRN
ncbi:MAG: hypothetical protein HYZ53_09740 [Planctomycetes bacterium]|nr:hypothetical protein [Planctomycetota bacterium]